MYRIFPVHNKEILQQLDDVSYKEYGKERFPTSKDWTDYCAMLRDHPYDKVSKATPWVLVEEKTTLEDVAKDLKNVLAQCETYRMDCEIRVGGTSQKGNVYGITVVFVEESKRKRGYASKLMELVMKEIEKNDNNIQAFLLYSIIGSEFYEKFGFKAVESFEWYLPIEAKDTYNRSANMERFLSGEEAQKEYLQIFKTIKREEDEFFIVPSPELVDWHYKLEGLFSASKIPRGLEVGKSKVLFRAEAFFNTLSSIYLHFDSLSEGKLLLDEMKEIASSLGLKEIVFFEDFKQENWKLLEQFGMQRRNRESLAMIRPLNSKIKPEMWRQITFLDWI